jgi:hypothetical protein
MVIERSLSAVYAKYTEGRFNGFVAVIVTGVLSPDSFLDDE